MIPWPLQDSVDPGDDTLVYSWSIGQIQNFVNSSHQGTTFHEATYLSFSKPNLPSIRPGLLLQVSGDIYLPQHFGSLHSPLFSLNYKIIRSGMG